MGKITVWNVNGREWWVGVDFCFLARNTFSGPLIDVSSHGIPEEAEGNLSTGGLNAWMARQNMLKNLLAEGKRNERA